MNGKPARSYRFKSKLKKQITYSLEQELRLAAQFAGYTWTDFQALPGTNAWVDPEKTTDDKATILAVFRLHNLMEAIRNDHDT